MNNTRFLYITDMLIPADINTWYFNPVQTRGVIGEKQVCNIPFSPIGCRLSRQRAN